MLLVHHNPIKFVDNQFYSYIKVNHLTHRFEAMFSFSTLKKAVYLGRFKDLAYLVGVLVGVGGGFTKDGFFFMTLDFSTSL